MILGGTVFDLLERERGAAACELLVQRLRREGPRGNLELAFEARSRDIERAWRAQLESMASPRAGDLGASFFDLDAGLSELDEGPTAQHLDGGPTRGRTPQDGGPRSDRLGGELVEDPDDQYRERRRR